MLRQGVVGGAEPPSSTLADGSQAIDRSMQVLEYVVAAIAVITALALAFLR